MPKGYSIDHLDPVNPGDPSKPTRQWQFGFGQGMHQITFYTRRAGCDFGGHVHNGEDPSKNPELLLLVSGEMEVKFLGLDGETEVVTVKAWDCLTIEPGVKHWMKALTDVTIVEPRRRHFDQAHPDTVLCE